MPYPAHPISPSSIADLQKFADSFDTLPRGTAREVNTSRAAKAARALAAYADDTAFDEQLGDLLSDLLHLADALGENPDQLLDSAHRRYTEEIAGEW